MFSLDLSDHSAEPAAIQRLSPEQKERLTDILDRYLSALEDGVPPPRESLLAAHPDLAGPLEAYLQSLDELHGIAAGFGNPSIRPQPEASSQTSEERRLGDFQLLREIGRGGMGVVYEARQISLGRRVALKVLPFAAVLDSKQIARFKNEAQAAAQLHHPNIVSVFAVGVERGVHYYAMQFIDGQPLDRAIAELRRGTGLEPAAGRRPASDPTRPAADAETDRPLPPARGSLLSRKSADRQEYFRTVVGLGIQAAEALHAAHEYGIVHRDVKPSNLLLDSDGKLWVTDFGLARCRQTDASLTRAGDVLGTTRYMSPEQARGQSALVDPRTDVYSLGATLYELLTLQPAFPGDDGPSLLRRIDQEEPPPLRQWQPRIPADLETVVRKAMAKSREERYATAREFADDLRRVLEGKPTIAKPPAIPERIGKWARRHHRLVAAVAAACLLALLGMTASTLLILREKARTDWNYQRANENYRQARATVDHFGKGLADRLADVAGAEHVRRWLLQETLQYYRAFAEQAKDDPKLRADLAETYGMIGELTGMIGSTEEAIAAHQSAIRLFRELADDEPHVLDHHHKLATSQNNLALLLARAGRTEEARRAYREAIRLQRDLAGRSRDGGGHLSDLALCYSNLGLLESETGKTDQAEASFREAIRLGEQLLEVEPDRPEHLRTLAASLNNLAALYLHHDPARALKLHGQALGLQQKAAAACPGEMKYQSGVALACNNLGAAHSRMGQFAQAAACYGRAIEILRGLVRDAPAQKSYRRDLAVSFNNLGLAQSSLHKPADAERSFQQALELEEALVRQNPHDVDLQSSLGGVYNNLGIVQEELQRLEDAATSYQKAVEHQRVAYAQAAEVSRYRVFLSKSCYNYARVLRRLGRPEEAARLALERKALWPNDPQRLLSVAEELAVASKLLAGSDRAEPSADQCAKLAVETLRQAVAAGWDPASDPQWTETFAALKDQPGFAELVKQ